MYGYGWSLSLDDRCMLTIMIFEMTLMVDERMNERIVIIVDYYAVLV
jgi:hypothetical protein